MENKTKFLNKFNLFMGSLHALQALAILYLSDPAKGLFPIITTYIKFNPITRITQTQMASLGQINVVYLMAGFFALSAIFHLLIGTVYRKKYEENLLLGINKLRWYEYSLSASIMMVAIAMLSGIFDLSSLIMIFVLDAVMNLMGLVMEKTNQGLEKTGKQDWLSYWIGCLAGITPWIVFGIYVWGITAKGGGEIPNFVYGIYVTIFIFFNSFAINMALQYKKVGPWKDYLFGEKVYIVLSLVAKSLLAWQIFFGALVRN